jgi:uncharacterized protein YkwD
MATYNGIGRRRPAAHHPKRQFALSLPYVFTQPQLPPSKPRFYREATRFAVALLLLAVFFAGRCTVVYAQNGGDSLSPTAQSIVNLINEQRAARGLPPLAVNPLLVGAAQSHANDLANNSAYGHTGSDGSSVRTRVRRTGYQYDWIGENWIHTTSPERAFAWWMSDPPHAQNILNANYSEIGIGEVATGNSMVIWVTDFAHSGEGAPILAAAPAEPALTATAMVEQQASVPPSLPADGLDYVIQAGDTLLSVGLRYGLDWHMIAAANGLSEFSVLQIGQTIHIPGAETSTLGVVGGPVYDFTDRYTVSAGDTLIGIATRYELSWQDLAAANGINEHEILQIGQALHVPVLLKSEPAASAVAAQAAAAVNQPPAHYTIAVGDTILGIALRYGLNWQELLRLNGLGESSVLQPGQQIRLR